MSVNNDLAASSVRARARVCVYVCVCVCVCVSNLKVTGDKEIFGLTVNNLNRIYMFWNFVVL